MGARVAIGGKRPPDPPAFACLVVILGRELGRKFDLAWGTSTLGSLESNTIPLPEENVSRRHASIVWDERGIVIRDERSTGGTFVNDRRITEHKLASGDCVRLGRVLLKFLAGEDLESAYHEELYRLSAIDALTQVFNRRYIAETLERDVSRARRDDQPVSVVLIDVDCLREINETFGASVGDGILRQLAGHITGDVVGRWSGDRFLLILHAALDAATAHAERIRSFVEHLELTVEGQPIPVTISVGVGVLEPEETATVLIERATARLEQAKADGRNRVVS